MTQQEETILGEGRYLVLKRRNDWELVDRKRVTGIAIIVAVTRERQAVLVEQYREPLGARTIEWAAGLVGDEEGRPRESLLEAANRELEEETGFRAERLSLIAEGPPSSGLTSEVVTFVRARELRKAGRGGGVDDEDIQVHLVPLAEIDVWLQARAKEGLLIDPKIYAGLYFLSKESNGV